MKKTTLLLALLFVSTIGFSQNKIGGDDPIPGIDIITKDDPGSRPIINPENNPLINKANDLKEVYLEKIAKHWFKNKPAIARGSGKRVYFGAYIEDNINKVNQEFYRIEGHMGKSNKDVFTAYIAFLKKKIAKEVPIQSTKMKTLKYRSRGQSVH